MDEPDDTDLTPEEFRAAQASGTPVRIVASREQFEEALRSGQSPVGLTGEENDSNASPDLTIAESFATASHVDWRSLSNDQLEKFVSVLLLREHPDGLRRLVRESAGLDLVVPVSDSPRRYDIYHIRGIFGSPSKQERDSIAQSAKQTVESANASGIVLRNWYLTAPVDPSEADATWIGNLLEEEAVIGHWFGQSKLHNLSVKYRDVVDYYVLGNREHLTTLVEDALTLTRQAVAAGETGFDDELEYKAVWAAVDRLNIDDPHYAYNLSSSYGEPDMAEVSDSDSIVMSHLAGRVGGPTMRIDVYPKYRLAIEDRPITASVRFQIPDSEEELRDAVSRFNTYGDDLEVPAPYATATFDDPIFGVTEHESLFLRVSSPTSAPRRVRYIVAEANGDRVATAFFNVQSRSEGPSGQGMLVRLKSDSGMISLDNWLTRASSDTYHGKFEFHLNWQGRIATRVVDELRFGNSMIGPRKLVLAQEFEGPFTEVAHLDELHRPAVPNWLVAYAEALAALQEYADVPLRLVELEDSGDSSEVERAIQIASILRGHRIGQRAPQIGIAVEGVDAAQILEHVQQTGSLRVVSPFLARVANGNVAIRGVTYLAENVSARIEKVDGATNVVISRPGGDVLLQCFIDLSEDD